MYCKNCGASVPEDSKYCSSCGCKIGEEIKAANSDAAADTARFDARTPGRASVYDLPRNKTVDPFDNTRPDPYANDAPTGGYNGYGTPINTNAPQNGAYPDPYANNKPNVQPKENTVWWGVLGFFFPVIGLILYLFWVTEFPARAKAAGVGALIGVAAGIVTSIFTIIFYGIIWTAFPIFATQILL